jgi:hypothetical protein
VSAVSVASAVWVVLGASVVQVVLVVLVVLAAQAALVGRVVPSLRAVAARGHTTLRIEAVPPTATSEPRTSLVGPRVMVRGSAGQGLAIGLPPEAGRGKAVPVPATGPQVPVRGSVVPGRVTGLVLERVTGPVLGRVIGLALEAGPAVTRLVVATSLEMVDPEAEVVVGAADLVDITAQMRVRVAHGGRRAWALAAVGSLAVAVVEAGADECRRPDSVQFRGSSPGADSVW